MRIYLSVFIVLFMFSLIILGSSSAGAQAVPPEFQVNTTTTGNQSSSAIGMNGPGRSVIVWADDIIVTGTIMAQHYDASGNPIGTETQLSTMSQVSNPDAAMGTNHFVAVWDRLDSGVTQVIDGQLYTLAGATVGPQFHYTGRNPKVAMHSSGSFVVVWEQVISLNIDVYAQRFDNSGAPVGSPILVNTYTTDSQEEPAIAMDGNGNFVVVWQSWGLDGDNYGIFCQRFTNLGVKVGPEFQVNSYTTQAQKVPDVAMDASGNFGVVWESFGQDGSSEGVFAQRYDNTGGTLGSEFQVNQYTNNTQKYVSAAMDLYSNLIICWMSFGQDGDGSGTFARRYDSSGLPMENEFQVNVYTTNYQSAEDVATGGVGNFVVTWSSYGQDGDQYGVFGRRYLGYDIPTVSQWGLIALLTLLLSAGILMFNRKRVRAAVTK